MATADTSGQDGSRGRSIEELQVEQARLGNDKLRIEIEKLKQDAKPESGGSKAVRYILSLGGLATLAATIFGIWDSYDKSVTEQAKTREEQTRTRLADERKHYEDAIKHVEGNGTMSKLVGISILGGYLNEGSPALQRQTLFTLASLMATEKDYQTQTAVVDLIEASLTTTKIARDDWRYFLDVLISQSRSLVIKGDLRRHRQFTPSMKPTDDEQAARTLARLITLVIRQGVVPEVIDFHDIYCANCDFRNVEFTPVAFGAPASFSGAILDNANFHGAKLRSAVFDNAELRGTIFVEADLTRASFRMVVPDFVETGDITPGRSTLPATGYLQHAASALDDTAVLRIVMPNFSCANLSGATFDGHTLLAANLDVKRSYVLPVPKSIPAWYASVPAYIKQAVEGQEAKGGNRHRDFAPLIVYPAKFYRAILTGADLERILMVDLMEKEDFGEYFSRWTTVPTAEYSLAWGPLGLDAFGTLSNDDAKKDLEKLLRRLRGPFFSAELKGVKLPEDLAKHLAATPPSQRDYSSTYGVSQFNQDPDRDCKPRNPSAAEAGP